MLFQFTKHCSLRCPHCLNESVPDGSHCSDETFVEFLRLVHDFSIRRIGLGGGEPTEHPRFLELFKELLRQYPLSISAGELSFDGIVLMTNGRFLVNNGELTKGIAALQKDYRFGIQISALKGLYPKRKETIRAYKKKKRKFQTELTAVVEQITGMQYMGRAKGKDWSHLGPLYDFQAPMCFNLFSVAKHKNSLFEVINFLEHNTKQFCKPMVAWDGSFHPGESNLCQKLGNINTDGRDVIFENLQNGGPCGECGVVAPPLL